MAEARPIWWPSRAACPQAEWAYVFEELTGEDSAEQWGLAAAIYIAQVRHRSGLGPTFSELFEHLLPDTNGLPAPFPPGLDYGERRELIHAFRGHTAIEWRRRGLINWDKNLMRSLRVGRVFRERSRSWQLSRGIDDAHSDGL